MSKLGKLASDGTPETEPTECAITGQPLFGHMVMQRVTGTRYFYRYLSDYQYLLTDELRAEIEAQIPQETIAPTTKKGKVQEMQSEVSTTEEKV